MTINMHTAKNQTLVVQGWAITRVGLLGGLWELHFLRNGFSTVIVCK
jgi:hypothetical protein